MVLDNVAMCHNYTTPIVNILNFATLASSRLGCALARPWNFESETRSLAAGH
jgi:hypothetical protein